jgi:hypothetical protein
MLTSIFSRNSFRFRLAIVVVACALSACAEEQKDRPQMGTLTRNFTMVDSTGRPYGQIMLDPLGGGKLIDSEGRVIGYVVSSQPE